MTNVLKLKMSAFEEKFGLEYRLPLHRLFENKTIQFVLIRLNLLTSKQGEEVVAELKLSLFICVT